MSSREQTRLPVIVLCQVSFGLGHWVRTRGLIEALLERFEITLVLGGHFSEQMQIPKDVHLVQIPAKGRGPDGHEIPLEPGRSLRDVNRARQAMLRTLGRELRPAAIVVEYYPFGRYELELDVMNLVEGSRLNLVGSEPYHTVVVSSLRDIHQRNRKWAKETEQMTLDGARAMFDAVFVHSDPSFAQLEETFPRAAELRIPIFHTGFIVPRAAAESETEPNSGAEPRRQILVHVGGGQGGEELLRAALQAWREGDLARTYELRVITGIFQDSSVRDEVHELAAGLERVEVVEWEPDLLAALRRARLSISRCGYNTALDLIRARIPALVVPYQPPHEDEQFNRGQRLEARGLVRLLPAAELTPARLLAEIHQTLEFEPTPAPVQLDGAERSASLLAELIERQRGLPSDS